MPRSALVSVCRNGSAAEAEKMAVVMRKMEEKIRIMFVVAARSKGDVLAVNIQWNDPFTLAFSPSDGKREDFCLSDETELQLLDTLPDSVSFPLTPALSLGEREFPLPPS